MPGAWELRQQSSVLCAILHTDNTTVAWALGLRNLILPGGIMPIAGMPYDIVFCGFFSRINGMGGSCNLPPIPKHPQLERKPSMSTYYSTSGKICYKSLAFMGYPAYLVGDNGSVWSRFAPGGQMGNKWRKKKPTCDGARMVVNLANKTFTVSRLVLMAFVGPCPEGMESCHWDGNCRNNNLNNLRWDTPMENTKDKLRHGTESTGERNHTAKLTRKAVRKIRELYMTGKYNYKKLTRMFGVTAATLTPIMSGKTWDYPDCYPNGFVLLKRTRAQCFKGVNRWTGVGCK